MSKLHNDLNRDLIISFISKGILRLTHNRQMFPMPSKWKSELLNSYLGLLLYHQVIKPFYKGFIKSGDLVDDIFKIATMLITGFIIDGDLNITFGTIIFLIAWCALSNSVIIPLLAKYMDKKTATCLGESIEDVVLMSTDAQGSPQVFSGAIALVIYMLLKNLGYIET